MESLQWGGGRIFSLPPISHQSVNIEVHGPGETVAVVVVVVKQTVAFKGSIIHLLILLGSNKMVKVWAFKAPSTESKPLLCHFPMKSTGSQEFYKFFFIWKKWDGEFGILCVQGYSAEKTINILGGVIILIKWLFMQLALVQSQSFLVDFKGL